MTRRFPRSQSLVHGIDLVYVPRFRAVFEGKPERWARIFTAQEISDCQAQRDPMPSLAARFAAKEATLKALGRGVAAFGIDRAWREIEVVRQGGPPSLLLHGGLANSAAEAGWTETALSLSHDGDYAMASLVAHAVGAPRP